MRTGIVLLASLLQLISSVAHAADANPWQLETRDRIEADFRAAMDAWAANQLWKLWQLGTRSSRSDLPESDFVERMRRGNARFGGEFSVTTIRTPSDTSTVAVLEARFRLESTRDAKFDIADRPFLMTLEEARWRVSLWDFVGLSSYFRPDYLPTPVRPTPHRGR